jgi:IS66 Orf2 like protein
MLTLPPSVRRFVATQPVDGRKGADSLMVIVCDVFKQDPLNGHLLIFFSKRSRIRTIETDGKKQTPAKQRGFSCEEGDSNPHVLTNASTSS